MEISISGQEMSGACPKCGKLRGFSLILITVRNSIEKKWRIDYVRLVCESCKLNLKSRLVRGDSTYLWSFADLRLADMELLLYRLYAVVTLAEKRKISDGQC